MHTQTHTQFSSNNKNLYWFFKNHVAYDNRQENKEQILEKNAYIPLYIYTGKSEHIFLKMWEGEKQVSIIP